MGFKIKKRNNRDIFGLFPGVNPDNIISAGGTSDINCPNCGETLEFILGMNDVEEDILECFNCEKRYSMNDSGSLVEIAKTNEA